MTKVFVTAARLGRVAAFAAGLTIAPLAAAQTVSDQEVPASGLNLPQNLQIFGKTDPHVRKPNAVVNESVITGTDVDQRVNFIVAVNELKLNEQDLQRLRTQILRSLVDETLQIQEAVSNKIEIPREDIDRSFNGVSRNFQRTPDQMRAWLRSIGSSERTLRRQIEGELAWSRLLRRRVSIEVSNAEIDAMIARMKADRGTPEYHLFEIYLSAGPERVEEVMRGQQEIIEQLKRGVEFQRIAAAISEATTKVKGGDLGWVRTSTLPDQMARATETMTVGQVAGPVEVPGGFSIIYLADKRQVLTADPRDAKLSLKQISIAFDPGMTQAQATNKAADFARATQGMSGCGDAARVAQATGAELVDNDQMRIKDLPAQLQQMMLDLQIGQATQPFGTIEDGVRVLVLCGRDDPQEAFEPDPEKLRDIIAEQRTNRRAERMLRDLRRDAIVEYK